MSKVSRRYVCSQTMRCYVSAAHSPPLARRTLANYARTCDFYARSTARIMFARSKDYNWLREEIVRMGPVYVKLGQIASSRTDVLPAAMAEALSGLQADMPCEPFEVVRSVVEGAMGSPLECLYESFERRPFAAASIAQVHRASVRGQDGRVFAVAVKVQRPNIRDSFVRELAILRGFARLLMLTGMREVEELTLVINDIERTIYEETNFTIEMRHMRAFRKALANEPRIIVPRTIHALTKPQVLTMEYVPSRRITEYDSRELANFTMRVLTKLVIDKGYVHCDPHPGNLGVVGDSKLVIYDYGMTARVSTQKRQSLRQACLLVFNRSAEQLGDLLVKNGIIVLRSKATSFASATIEERVGLTRIFEHVFEYLEHLDASVLAANLSSDPYVNVDRLPFRVDDALFFLFRSMAVLEGVCKHVHPGFNYQFVITSMLFEFMDSETIVNKVTQDLTNLRNLRFEGRREPSMSASSPHAPPPAALADNRATAMMMMLMYAVLLLQ